MRLFKKSLYESDIAHIVYIYINYIGNDQFAYKKIILRWPEI